MKTPMNTLRALLSHEDEGSAPLGEPTGTTGTEAATTLRPARQWNTLGIVGVGPVADIDERGAIFLRDRPVSVEVWFGAGDRWVRGSAADGVRQSRTVGMPIIETRQRLGDADVVQTAWADGAGGGQSRVVVSLQNEMDVAAIVAVVVRPHRLLGAGRIENVRIAGERIVVDSVPLVELGRIPGDTAGAIDDDRSTAALLTRLELSDGDLLGDETFTDDGGQVSFAALLPLTPGVERIIEIIDGREAASIAAAPLDMVVSGWGSHLGKAAEIELPAWPKHILPALQSGLLGAAPDSAPPLGDTQWQPHDDTLLVVALGGAGLYLPAATVATRLLEAVVEGRLDRDHWPALAVGLATLADSGPGSTLLESHGDAITAVVGHTLTAARTEALVPRLLRVIEVAHGSAAAADAAAIRGTLKRSEDAIALARHGVAVPAQFAADVQDALHRLPSPLQAETIGFAMVASATIARPFEPLVPMRALAGSTWSWPRNGCGDSAHARAALLIGLRSLCLTEYPAASGSEILTTDSSVDIDLFPGTQKSWLGQSMEFSRMPTSIGLLSAAIRWHGARPALLWEIEANSGPFELNCSRLDPSFRTSELSGETLLAAPEGPDS